MKERDTLKEIEKLILAVALAATIVFALYGVVALFTPDTCEMVENLIINCDCYDNGTSGMTCACGEPGDGKIMKVEVIK